MLSKFVMRRVVKGAAAGLAHYSGIRNLVSAVRRRQAGGRRVLILSYHRVVESFEQELKRSIPGLLISQATFRRHLEEAHAAGYDFASIGDAVDVIGGRRKAKRDLCVITFDDGYRDVYRYAFPVMKEMGVPAITYLPSSFIGTNRRLTHDRLFHLVKWVQQNRIKPVYDSMPPAGAELFSDIFSGRKSVSAALDDFIEHTPNGVLTALVDALEQQLGDGPELKPEQGDLMSWDEVRKMSKAGFDFGAHTLHHTVLTLESPEAIEHEIRTSKEVLERELGKPVVDFAYCNGWYSDTVIEVLKRNGFRSAVTTEDFPVKLGDDPFTLKRKVLWENFSTGAFGDYSSSLTQCQLDDVFGILRVNHPVPGRRPQTTACAIPASAPAARAVGGEGGGA